MKKETENTLKETLLSAARYIAAKIAGFISGNYEIIIFIAAVAYKSILLNKSIGVKYSDTSLFLSCLGAVLAITSISLWFKRKTRIITLLVLDFAVTSLMVADAVFYRFFNDVISTPVLMQMAVVGPLGHSISTLFKPIDLFFVCDIVACIPVVVYLLVKKQIVNHQRFLLRAISAVLVLLVGIGLISNGFGKVNKLLENRAFTYVFDHTFFLEAVGDLNFHGFDACYFVVNKFFNTNKISESEKNNIKAAFAVKKPEESPKLNGAYKGCNLIVVQVEALQNLTIGLKVEGKEVTPNLNKFIKRSIYFNNYYSQTMQGSTSDAEFLSNTSYYPLAEGSVYFQNASNTFESLPSTLKAQGYYTTVMHPFRPSYWNRSTFYPALGFDKFESQNDFKTDEVIGWGLSDMSFLKQSIEKMQKAKKPFYSFVITLSSHYPYDMFENSTDFDAGKYNHTFYGNYIKGINYADKALGAFIDELDKSGLMDKSVLAIYGDHAAIQKNKLADMKDCLQLNEDDDIGWIQMTNIPLFIHLPGDKESGIRTTAGGQVDLFPTMANLLGLKPKFCLGKDLLNTEKGFAVLRDGSVSDGKTVYLKAHGECYDIKSGQKVDSSLFKDFIEMAREQLNTSDSVIKNNLIPYLEK